MKENEQWKVGGDCEKCLRKNYCGSQCKEHKRFIQKIICCKIMNYFLGRVR